MKKYLKEVVLLRTSEQLRAARAIKNLSRDELAKLADISPETIKRLESQKGDLSGNISTINALNEAFTKMNISFLNNGEASVGLGVSFKKSD